MKISTKLFKKGGKFFGVSLVVLSMVINTAYPALTVYALDAAEKTEAEQIIERDKEDTEKQLQNQSEDPVDDEDPVDQKDPVNQEGDSQNDASGQPSDDKSATGIEGDENDDVSGMAEESTTVESPSGDNSEAGSAEISGGASGGEVSEDVGTDVISTDEDTNVDTSDEAPKVLDQKPEWQMSENGKKAEIGPVELGVTYRAPQNKDVSVTFTKLPEESGNLVIEEITLTDEQVTSLGALSNTAYDITSDMKNGTFEYDLTLPKPEKIEDVVVKYAEDKDKLDEAKTVEKVNTKDDKIEAEDLDHFTVFVVVDDGDTNYSDNGWSSHGSGYNGDHHYVQPSQTGKTVTWTFVGDAGEYAILPSWVIWSDHATNAHYTSLNIEGFEIKNINQKKHANASITSTANGTWSGWYPNAGRYNLERGDTVNLSVELGTDGNLVADAMAFINLNEIYVDDSWSRKIAGEEVGTDKVYGINAFDTIQEGIDAVSSGGTVNVAAGTYTEQVVINKNLTLQGAGAANTTIKAPSSPTAFTFTESGAKTWQPVVFAFGGTANAEHNITGTGTIQVDISGFTVDGNDREPSQRSAGILLRNIEGTISNNTVQNMLIDGKETFGIVAQGDSDVIITKNNVSGYSRGGIGVNGDSNGINVAPSPTPYAVITNNTIEGPGMEVPVTWAPNGIQIGWGATGKITNNTVNGNGWPGTDWTGSGILVFASNGVEVDANTVEDNETGIAVAGYMWNSNGLTASGTWIHDNTVDGNTYGISIQDKSVDTTIKNNTVKNSTYDGIDICNFYGNPPTGTVIESNTITGNNDEEDKDSGGIWIDGGVDGSEVTVNLNKIVDNKKYGIINESTTGVVDATKNWWGTADSTVFIDKISGNVDYDPWCLDEGCTQTSDKIYSENITTVLSDTPQDINVGGLVINDIKGTGNIFVAKYESVSDVPGGGITIGAGNFYYNIEASGATFPINIEIAYSDTATDDNYLDEAHFSSLYYYSGSEWKDYRDDDPASTISIDKANNKIIASLQHLTPIVPTVDTEAPSIPVLTWPINGEYTNDSSPLMQWADSTDDTGVAGYYYRVYYHCSNENDIPGSCSSLYPNTAGTWREDSEYQAGVTSDGIYYWQVKAKDNLGNESDWSELEKVIIDTQKPPKPTGLKRESKDGSMTYDCGATVQRQTLIPIWDDMSFGDPSFDHYEYASFKPDGNIGTEQNLSVNKFDHNWVPTEDGTNGFVVRSVDKAGNVSDWALSGKSLEGSCKITYDSTAPTQPQNIVIYKGHATDPANQIPAEGYTNNTEIRIAWDANTEDDLDYYWFGTKSNPHHKKVPKTQTYYDGNITPGNNPYFYKVTAVDKVGNESSVGTSYNIYLDQESPTKPEMLGFKNPDLNCGAVTNIKTVTVDWSDSSDNVEVVGYDYNIDYPTGSGRGSWDTFVDQSQRRGDLNEGIHYIKVRSKDAAGNVSDWSDVCSITYDSIPPAIPTLVSPDNNAIVNGNPTQSWSSTDSDIDHYIYESWKTTDTADIANRIYSTTTTGTSRTVGGNQTITFWWRVKAVDAAGNESNWSDLWKVTVDNEAPVLSSKTDFEGWFNSAQTSTFHYADDNMADGYADPTCEIDTEGADQTCSITPNICDKAGNCNTTTQISNGADIDFTVPASVITYPEGDNEGIVYVNNWNGTISGTASDNLSGVRKVELVIKRDINGAVTYWDGSGWQTNEIYVLATETNSWTYGPLALPLIEGTYTIESHATDNAGNTENTYKLTIVLDKTIPTVDLAINPTNPDGDNGWYVSSPNIILTANDKNLDKIEYKIDSGNWTTYANPVRIDDGKYVLYYRSLDKAGNYSDEGVKNVKADTREPDHIKNVDADWNADTKKVKLSWDVEDSDIDKVYIYRGGRKGFHVNNDTKIAENNDNDESYSDDDRKPGEKYYYKFVSRDDAGNSSDVKIISVRIPLEEGEEAIVIDEGTEPIEVAGEETTVEEKEESSSEEENSAGEEAILGDEGIQSSGETSQDVEVLGEQKTKSYIAKIQDVARTWQFWLSFLLVISFAVWYLKRRKKAE